MVKTSKIKAYATKFGYVGATVITAAALLFGGIVGYQNHKMSKENVALVDTLDTFKMQLNATSGQITGLEDNLAQVLQDYAELENEYMKEQAENDELQKQIDDLSQEPEPTEGTDPVVDNTVYDLKSIDINTVESFTFDDRDLDGLFDGKISFDGDNYDVYDALYLSNVVIATNGDTSYDDEFEGSPYLLLTQDRSLGYELTFEDGIDYSDISIDEPLEVTVLGKDYKIVGADSNSFEYSVGEKLSGAVGDTFVYDNKTVEIKAIGEDTVFLSVDGNEVVVDEDETETVGNYEVTLLKSIENTYAQFEIGTDEVYVTIDDGDDYEGYDDWKWSFVTDSGNIKSIGVYYDETIDEADESPVGVNDVYTFPESFASVGFVLEDYDVTEYKFSFDECESNNDGLEITSNEDNGFEINGDETDYVCFDGTSVFYDDEDGDEQTADLSDVSVVFEDTVLGLDWDNSTKTFSFGDLDMKVTGFKYLGATEEESESDELSYGGFDIGNIDYDVLTSDFFVIKEHEDEDSFTVEVPSDDVEADIKVSLL